MQLRDGMGSSEERIFVMLRFFFSTRWQHQTQLLINVSVSYGDALQNFPVCKSGCYSTCDIGAIRAAAQKIGYQNFFFLFAAETYIIVTKLLNIC